MNLCRFRTGTCHCGGELEYQKEMPWLLQIPFPREGDVQPRITVIALRQTHKRRKRLEW